MNKDIDKTYIRNINKIKRLRMSNEEKKSKDEEIFKKIVSLEIFKKKEIILSYVSTEVEVDTKNIINYCLKKHKKVAVPFCVPNKTDIEFYFVNSLDELKVGSFFILEPERNISNLVLKEDIDKSLCLVPGMAYSFLGHRIGFGKGYYDRFLYKKKCVKIGLCYDFNLQEDVLNNCLDVAVDVVVTEGRILNIV